MCLVDLPRSPGRAARAGVSAGRMLNAAEHLVGFCNGMDECGLVLDISSCDTLLAHWKVFLVATDPIPERKTFKRHSIVHMIQKACWVGNPRYYANWNDEGLNRALKGACRKRPSRNQSCKQCHTCYHVTKQSMRTLCRKAKTW